jgi:hypothetical protein
MKVIITENKLNSSIEKYILNGYPMVKRVFFTTKKIRLASEPNSKGENDIVRNIVNIDFIDGKMTHSPSYVGRQIRNDINSMFGLYINTYGASWGMEVKMVRD